MKSSCRRRVLCRRPNNMILELLCLVVISRLPSSACWISTTTSTAAIPRQPIYRDGRTHFFPPLLAMPDDNEYDENVNGDNLTNDIDKGISGSTSSTTNFVLYRPEDEETSCLPPGKLPEIKLIFLVSDATGVTARSTLLKSLAQFDTCADEGNFEYDGVHGGSDNNNNSNSNNNNNNIAGSETLFGGTCDVRTRTFTFIRSPHALLQVLKAAQQKSACVMYTLADPHLRQLAYEFCHQNNILQVDLVGPSLDILSKFLNKTPLGIPARLSTETKRKSHYLGDSYYRRINAVEFALKADDGQSPWLLSEADIVLVGVSRSGKTPLSVVLSQTMSLKVANIPLVVDISPPKQLLEDVDQRRVFCLTISPSELRKIRTNRLERRGIKDMENKDQDNTSTAVPRSNYADRNYLLRDLHHAKQLSLQHNWTMIDVTGRAVEETATLIVEQYNERFFDTYVDDDDNNNNGNDMDSNNTTMTSIPSANQYVG